MSIKNAISELEKLTITIVVISVIILSGSYTIHSGKVFLGYSAVIIGFVIGVLALIKSTEKDPMYMQNHWFNIEYSYKPRLTTTQSFYPRWRGILSATLICSWSINFAKIGPVAEITPLVVVLYIVTFATAAFLLTSLICRFREKPLYTKTWKI